MACHAAVCTRALRYRVWRAVKENLRMLRTVCPRVGERGKKKEDEEIGLVKRTMKAL